MRASKLITPFVILSLVAMTLGIFCGPLKASVPENPMDHCNQEESHDAPMACCVSHVADVASATLSLNPPQVAAADFGPAAAMSDFDWVQAVQTTLEWPPGSRHLATLFCALLI